MLKKIQKQEINIVETIFDDMVYINDSRISMHLNSYTVHISSRNIPELETVYGSSDEKNLFKALKELQVFPKHKQINENTQFVQSLLKEIK